MEPDKIFLLNDSDMIFESFEDEIVAINLKNGFYYSINGSGITIWKLLMKAFSPRQILGKFKKEYTEITEAFEHSFFDFVNRLESEGFIISGERESGMIEKSDENFSEKKENNKPSPPLPVLEKYTDQQELLLLDPIHEVTDLGWPDGNKKEPENE